ncbi:MAG TPA: D-2-hydroxyacid dehydrogenase [Vicinamibacterales bacterium]|nr:D-2-hydroxyacid dehydrogenase [Vicinamibacterales bacterium]
MRVLVSIQQPVKAWQIPPEAVARLRHRFPALTFIHATDDETRARGLEDCDIAYTWILSSAEVAAARRLRWVHTSAVAVETLALPDLFSRNIIVSNSRGVQATPIAEHVFAVVLALAKQLPFILENQRAHRWAQNDVIGDRLPWLLRRRTLGLIGVGTIGSELALLADAFGMHVIGLRRRPGNDPVAGVHEMLAYDELDTLLTRADVVVIAAPLTPETTSMIGPAQLARMKRGALLINVGRARIVDHVALTEALHSRHLGGASLDVFHQEPLPADDPLWSAPNVILTPHTSGFRQGHWDDVIDLFAENIERFQRGEPVRFRVESSLGY